MSVEVNELRNSVRQVIDGLDEFGARQALWNQSVELGWLLAGIPEELDGLGMGDIGTTAIHLELGRGLCAAPCLGTMLCIDAICQSSLPGQAAWLERFISGAQASASLTDSQVEVVHKTLNGCAVAMLCADSASHALVWSERADLVALIALDQAGVCVKPRKTWDETRQLFDITLSNLPLTEQTLLAEGEAARKMVTRLEALRDYGLAADAIGAANALLEMTVEHLNTRIQFRRPLAMFQALKHRCADLKTMIVAAEALLFDSLNRHDSEAGAAAAKQLATQTFTKVAEESLQLHGGIGMADEHPCHLFLKRALLSEHLGKTQSYEERIAEQFLSTL